MKRKNVKKISCTWLLLMLFILPQVTRVTHIFQTEYKEICSHAEDHESHEHDCYTCPVCKFFYATYIKAEFGFSGTFLTTISHPVLTFYNYKKYNSLVSSNQLRASPFRTKVY